MSMLAMVLLSMSNPSPLEELALQLERVPCLPQCECHSTVNSLLLCCDCAPSSPAVRFSSQLGGRQLAAPFFIIGYSRVRVFNPRSLSNLAMAFSLSAFRSAYLRTLRYETGGFFFISRATYCGVSVRVKGVGSSCPVPYRRWRNPLNSPSEPISSNFASSLASIVDKAVSLSRARHSPDPLYVIKSGR
jgi:hypothetical protein